MAEAKIKILTEGQFLTGYFVDECKRQGRPHLLAQKGQMARRAKELLDTVEDGSGITFEGVQLAITEYIRRDCRTPLMLAEIASEQLRQAAPSRTPWHEQEARALAARPPAPPDERSWERMQRLAGKPSEQ